jgi:hypothetical protein
MQNCRENISKPEDNYNILQEIFPLLRVCGRNFGPLATLAGTFNHLLFTRTGFLSVTKERFFFGNLSAYATSNFIS